VPLRLGEEPADPRELRALLVPYSSEEMIVWAARASTASKNSDPSLIELIKLIAFAG
jgi:hypothetical protein